MTTKTLENGPGLKWLNRKERWYGGGYCGICGDTNVIPRACRYWDCDDGWRHGVLCEGCADDAQHRGPQPEDYAYQEDADSAVRIDVESAYGDSDSAYAQSQDRHGWR